MSKQITAALVRDRSTILSDALGLASLAVMLFVGLSLPGLV
ncbi:hypothetical protein [Salipiger sp. IMCC34102]|nr:hypothetical protein [Salipiger sp. IMCC34102]